jgi:hypothetical protein
MKRRRLLRWYDSLVMARHDVNTAYFHWAERVIIKKRATRWGVYGFVPIGKADAK